MASARNAINVLIKLLGGAEMTAELEKLGTTGEKAMTEIETSAKNVNLANLGGAISAFGGDLATFGKRTAEAFAGVAAAVTAAAPFVLALAKSGADAADEAGKAAQAAGLQAKSYQELAFAADSVGVSQQQLGTAMDSFNKQVVKTADETVKGAGKIGSSLRKAGKDAGAAAADITQGAGYTVQAFKDIGVEVTRFGANASKLKTTTTAAKTGFDELGIKVKDASGKLKDNEKLLLEVANAFQKMPDGARKSQIALKLFGEEGAKLIPLLDLGAAGIDQLKQKAADLGIIFSDEQIKAATEFNDALSELKKSVASTARQVGLIFAPSFTAGANAFRDIVDRNRTAILDFVRNGLQVATVFVKDFFATLSGRDADVTSNRWLIAWRDAIKGFGEDFVHVSTGVVIPAMAKLREAADLTIKAVNGIFGSNITTGEVLIGAAIVRMVGGFALLRSAIGLTVEALAFLSRGLLLTPAGRLLIIAAGVAEVIGVLATKQTNAAGSAEAHKNALDQLKTAMDAVKNGVPGAKEQLKQLAETQLAAAKAALVNAEEQVKHQKEILDGFKANPFSVPLGTDIGALTDAYVQSEINLARRVREVKEVQATLDGKVVGNIEDMRDTATKGAAGVNQLGAAVDQTSGKVENLDHQITVFRGGSGGITKEVFDVVDGVARRADQSKQALDGVATSAQTAGDHVKTVANDVKEALTVDNGVGAGLSSAVGGAVDSVVSDVKKIAPAADAAATGLKDALDGADAGGLGSAISDSVDGVVTNLSTLAPAADDAVGGLNSVLANIDTGAAQQSATAIAQPFQELPSLFSQIFSGIGSLIQGGFANLAATVSSLAGQIRSEIASIIAALQAAVATAQSLRAQASSAGSGGGGGHGGFAGGGRVVGAGGPRDDSILAWLSNGEFVIQASAAKKLGLEALNALNNGFIPSLKGLRGFNLGGVVDNFSRSMAIPRFAAGGLAVALPSGTSSPENAPGKTVHVKLDFGLGPEDVISLVTPDYVAYQLTKVAIKASRLTNGRAPRRY
ncbi:hypothetical protein FJ970_22580 [Mesorhizobium sp. B2-1-8]|uniref:hypothetical protein n=1 Tax=Mesorhizobium sp. B2-1-8 TaxID=2589967 RepID=UPI0011275CDF|nr:hypothetical protein [Mesorhizobium sp. B2-1-8]UCI17871.1 hypothetical protein FJ970_22580 [Mesorhizobium sp. B2-1-8]